jgi:hypothetical protein
MSHTVLCTAATLLRTNAQVKSMNYGGLSFGNPGSGNTSPAFTGTTASVAQPTNTMSTSPEVTPAYKVSLCCIHALAVVASVTACHCKCSAQVQLAVGY